MNLFLETLLVTFISVLAPEPEPFEKFYSDFKNTTTLTYNATFKGYGKNEKKGILAEGKIFIEKKDFDIVKYRSLAVSELSILEKVNFDDVLYDGENVYVFDSKKGTYINYGKWNENGKQHNGYSGILFGNLFAIVQLFEKEKATIIYTSDENGFQFKLPANLERGEVIMNFKNGDRLPYQVTRYNEKNNSNDYIILSIGGVRVDISFPTAFFHPQNAGEQAVKDDYQKTAEQSGTKQLLPVNSVAPSWELVNSDGQKKTLNDYRGKIVIMDFWATWCAPCVAAQPALQSIHEKYKDVAVLGMDCQEHTSVDLNAYKARKKLTYEMLTATTKTDDDYHVSFIPVLYIIDRSGKIIYAETGYSDKTELEWIKVIEKALR